jgi:hypothetical protein
MTAVQPGHLSYRLTQEQEIGSLFGSFRRFIRKPAKNLGGNSIESRSYF